MVKLNTILDINELESEIDQGYISCRLHSAIPYRILNYTNKAQIEWRWNKCTINCRGLIVDNEWNIIARPFKKFFTLNQWQTLKNSVWNLYDVKYSEMFNGPFEIWEKIDGSLGVLFWNPQQNRYEIATRGSFNSDQAIKATQILWNKYPDLNVDHKKFTYLFEIIYPENKIVVDYGEKEDIILLAVIENETGKEISLYSGNINGFSDNNKLPKNISCVRLCKFYNWRNLDKLNWRNKEGFVVHFLNNDIRVKIKFEEYKSLAKILNSLDEKLVLEWTRNNYDCGQVLDKLPADTQKLAADLQYKIWQEYTNIENECRELIKRDGQLPRKEFACLHKDRYFSSVLFAMLDGKDYRNVIWKIIEKMI